MNGERRLRIEFTAAQQEQIKRAFGQDSESVELRIHDLEERIAPTGCASGVHYSTVVITG